MKNIRFITLIIAISLGFNGCKKDFSLINTNINAPVDVQPDLLLRQVIYDIGDNMSYEGFVAGNLLSQHFSEVDFNQFDRHNLRQPQLGGNPWPVLYKNLRDNELILAKVDSDEIFRVYEGPSRILKAYMSMILTDLFGDVPYSEALKGLEGNVTPKYDKQEDVYLASGGILDQLNKAIAAIDAYTAPQTLGGDILYNGNLSKWRKFALSLKIKALIRISDRDSEIALDVAQELQAIVTEGMFINSNSDNAFFQFTATQPNSFRMQKLRTGDFNLFVMSQTSDTLYQKYADPRFNLFFRGTSANTTVYNGLINGIDNSAYSVTLSTLSLPGTIFRENTAPLKCNFMTAWETQFLLAEAALKGYISGSPDQYYNDGVTNSFAYWNVTMPSGYLTSGAALYDPANALEQIITQKWISNTINAYESWIEYSRTGFPALLPVASSLNNGIFPVRMPYPSDESALNANNYSEASANTNGNSINFKVWWDKF